MDRDLSKFDRRLPPWNHSPLRDSDALKLKRRLRGNVNLSRLDFLLGLIQVPPEDFRKNARRSRYLLERMAAFCLARIEVFKPLRGIQIEQLCLRVRTGIEDFLARKPWDTPAGPRRRVQFDLAGRPSTTYFTENLAVAFEWAAQDLIKEESNRIRRCEAPSCDKLFIRTKASRYCSISHSQQARSRRFYHLHKAELSERRHELYKVKVAVERGEVTAKKVRRQKRAVRS
ncbi:MAG: hypothetical protein ACLQAT_12360 [Candidatus Binataceae bacterium]